LIGFFKNATDGVDRIYDGLRLDSGRNISFYSILEGKNYGIQGKSPLKELEEIPLGLKSNITGIFSISINHFQGKLNGSKVYLYDKLLNILHDLKLANYTFSINESNGTNNNRFVLKIETGTDILNVDAFKNNNKLIVTQNLDQLEISISNQRLIVKVVIYDILGRKLIEYTKQPLNKIILSSKKLKDNSIFIIKAYLGAGEVLVKKHYKN
jgi:hypothetical protein